MLTRTNQSTQLVADEANSADAAIEKRLVSAVENLDIILLKSLSTTLYNFNDLVKKLGLNEDMVQWILSVDDDIKLSYFQSQFRFNTNSINYSGISLTCAQIANRKKELSFKPTVLLASEFDDYVDFVAKMPRPLREKFIIEGSHRICGDICINEEGKASMVLLDSIGDTYYNSEYLSKFARTFPNASIFVPATQLQNDGRSCAIFALDGLFQLCSIEKYLPEKYKQSATPLHAYIAEHKVKKIYSDDYYQNGSKVFSCNLPLRMMLNMQSSSIFSEIESRCDEAGMPVNKRGETALIAAKKHFRQKASACKESNHRIEDKLKRMYVNNMHFLFANRMNDVDTEISKFSFAAMKKAHAKPKRSHDNTSSDDAHPVKKRVIGR